MGFIIYLFTGFIIDLLLIYYKNQWDLLQESMGFITDLLSVITGFFVITHLHCIFCLLLLPIYTAFLRWNMEY